jgi:YidC/Oxa1 family membrane protein insertase
VIVAGILTPIEDVFTEILIWFHGSVGLTWAWSIVALVVCVRILLVPVTVRQIHSMQNLQAHAPEMKEIQKRWKHDRQRQNEELMKFYKDNKINPAASCLPIVVQIPIFIALFFVLRGFEAEILCQKIEGLATTAQCNAFLETFPASNLEFLGLVNITEPTLEAWGPLLLVIYVASQLTSTYYMSATATMPKAQRYLLFALPIIFIPFIVNFPAGLMIYWLTTNLWTTGQGVVTRSMMPKPDLTQKRSSRTEPKEPPPDAGNGSKRKGVPSSPAGGKTVAGPPRRVKRKRGGGSRR